MDFNLPDYIKLLKDYSSFRVPLLKGRYLNEENLLEVFKTMSRKFKIKNEGHSEEGRIISSFRLGHGPHKILIWSQMHGNETTTTKSVLDLLNYFILNPKFSETLFDKCSFIIIPVLNPDGAFKYTRFNANSVDLNRDASLKTQSESRILQRIYKEFEPDVCLNMHDQRTIFSAGEIDKPATVSFLSPSFNEERDINEIRKRSMSLISSANRLLQQFIPDQVGRYDDGFNINCIGDYFQKDGTPTVLFEAGHFQNDYEREQTRKYIFMSLLHMIYDVANQAEINSEADYFRIPENQKLFYDVILRNVQLKGKCVDMALQFKETLSHNRIKFVPVIEKIENLSTYFGHREIDVEHRALLFDNPIDLRVGEVLATFKVNDNVFVI